MHDRAWAIDSPGLHDDLVGSTVCDRFLEGIARQWRASAKVKRRNSGGDRVFAVARRRRRIDSRHTECVLCLATLWISFARDGVVKSISPLEFGVLAFCFSSLNLELRSEIHELLIIYNLRANKYG